MSKTSIKASRSDKIYNATVVVLLAIIMLIVAYPLWFVVIASISDPVATQTGKIVFWPKGITSEGYKLVLEYPWIWVGFRNSVIYTVLGTSLNLILTLAGGYGLSYKDLPGRGKIMGYLSFTMFFGGGMVPTYMVMRSLGLVNNPIIMVLMGAVSVWNLILARNYFESNIPVELREAAQIDGCSDFGFFIKIALPISTAIIAVLTIYYATGHWNGYMNAIIYLNKKEQQTLQVFLRELLITETYDDSSGMVFDMDSTERTQMVAAMKYCVIIISSLPMILLYPFMQRYFVKGIMVGAIKG